MKAMTRTEKIILEIILIFEIVLGVIGIINVFTDTVYTSYVTRSIPADTPLSEVLSYIKVVKVPKALVPDGTIVLPSRQADNLKGYKLSKGVTSGRIITKDIISQVDTSNVLHMLSYINTDKNASMENFATELLLSLGLLAIIGIGFQIVLQNFKNAG